MLFYHKTDRNVTVVRMAMNLKRVDIDFFDGFMQSDEEKICRNDWLARNIPVAERFQTLNLHRCRSKPFKVRNYSRSVILDDYESTRGPLIIPINV